MSTVVCQVEELHPAAVVTLAGTLNDSGAHTAENVLRDCLAEIPAVLLVDIAHLAVVAPNGLIWLEKVVADALVWPTVPVYVCGGDGLVTSSALPAYPTLEVARSDWADASEPQRRVLQLPPEADSCARARTFVAKVCTEWALKRPARIAQLLVSELVANAIMHARTSLAVMLRRYGEGLELIVRDDGPGRVPEKLPDDPRGFGLQLVDAMSDRWGSALTGGGKVVWTRLSG